MSPIRVVIVSLVGLWIAGGCQQTVAPRMMVFHAAPDFLLVTSVCIGLFLNRWSAGVVGFAAGLLQGALAGANLASYAISRTAAGFATGWLSVMELDRSMLLAILGTFSATILAQLLLMFGAPPPAITPFLLATIGTAIYNGVIAVPVFALVKRILDPPNR